MQDLELSCFILVDFLSISVASRSSVLSLAGCVVREKWNPTALQMPML